MSSMPSPDSATRAARAPTDWKTRRDAAPHRAGAMPPSAASGCSASARSLISAAFLVFLLVTMLGNGAARLHADRDRAADRFPARRADRSIPLRLQRPQAPSWRWPAPTSKARPPPPPIAAFGPDGADCLSDGAWLQVRDAVKDDPVAAERHGDDRGARRRPRSTSPPRATATPAAEADLSAPRARAGRCRHGFNTGLPHRARIRPIRRASASGARSRARC